MDVYYRETPGAPNFFQFDADQVVFDAFQAALTVYNNTGLALNTSSTAAALVAEHPGYSLKPPTWCSPDGTGGHVIMTNVRC